MASAGEPRCPNHCVPLQRSGTPGIGICPISGYRFSYQADDAKREMKVDLFGRPLYEWKVESLDGSGG